MRAHEWTRARQRSVRQLGGAPGEVAEEEAQEATEPDSALLTEEDPAKPASALQAGPVEAVEEVQPEPVAAAEPREPPEEKPEPDDVAGEAVAAAAQAGLFTDPDAAAAPLPRPTATTLTRRRSTSRPQPQQGELPLGLEPLVEKPSRRSATETREDLIQRLLDPHLSLQETAKLLNVCPTTVRRYTNRGLLAHYRTPGNQRRFRLSDVLAFMERQGIPAHGLERKRSSTVGEDEGATDDGP